MRLPLRLLGAAGLFGVISATNAFAQQSACKAIQDPKARLECFDAAPTVQPKATAPPKAEAGSAPKKNPNSKTLGEWEVTKEHGWELNRRNNPMTDKIQCIITPVGKPYAVFKKRIFFISYEGRGGVKGYQYRLDDGPATEFRLATDLEEESDMISFSGNDFDRLLAASRLRLHVLTVLRNSLDEDFALVEMRGLFAKMRQECPD